MSRCFPFPPPGYDKKARADDPDLIKKEKQREKKHKKEKKDKEKKDGKEKRGKDRSDEKHREKKDKKEKKRDRKKDKHKDQDKNKNSKTLSDEKRVAGQSEGYNVQKPQEKSKDREKDKSIALDEKRIVGFNEEELNRNSHLGPETKDFKYVPELASRSRDKQGRTSNQLQERHVNTEPKKDEGMVKLLGESAAILVHGTEKSKEKEKHVSTEWRMEEGMVKLRGKSAAILVDGTGRSKEKKVDDGQTGMVEAMPSGHALVQIRTEARPSGNALVHNRIEARPGGNALVPNKVEARPSGNALVHKKAEARPSGNALVQNKAEARPSGNALVHNSTGMSHTRVEGMAKPVEKNIDWSIDGREKVREKEADGKKTHKWKDKDGDRASKKDRDREREKKKEEKVKQQEYKHVEPLNIKDNRKSHIEHSRVIDVNINDHLGAQTSKLQSFPNESNMTAAAHENIRKRKEFEPNGVVHEDDFGPKKMARTLSSSHLSTQNGRSLEPCQASIVFGPDVQQAPNNVKPDGKECKLNGMVNAQPVERPPQVAAHADHSVEAYKKPPHPDSKYLGKVLSVPKVDEWSDFDDQVWLFSSRLSGPGDPEVETSGVGEASQVWAEAVQIESADLIAMPYVIPL
ncbi:hypothetical protein Ancab_014034 [Ancistrocladus abbreviatus]